MKRTFLSLALAGLTAALIGTPALAQKKYDTGATDKEILIGGISPYSGPASSYGAIGKAIDAYFKKVNAEGGVNGRQIKFISLDDGYNPARTVEQARKLVDVTYEAMMAGIEQVAGSFYGTPEAELKRLLEGN